jgi:hypothetical protein
MKALLALGLLMSLALQSPLRLLMSPAAPSAGPDTCPDCEGPMSDHHVCKEPRR